MKVGDEVTVVLEVVEGINDDLCKDCILQDEDCTKAECPPDNLIYKLKGVKR